MQDLHRDAPTGLVHAVGDEAVIGDILGCIKPGSTRKHAALGVGGHAAGDHQPDIGAGAGGVEFGHPVPVAGFLQPGMHGAHDHAILQRDGAEIDRAEKMRIGGHGGRPSAGLPL